MKTITIDITDCLYYGLPILIMFIICIWYFMKYEYDKSDNIEIILAYFVLSLLFTTLFSLLYFGLLHLILDYHYTFTF